MEEAYSFFAVVLFGSQPNSADTVTMASSFLPSLLLFLPSVDLLHAGLQGGRDWHKSYDSQKIVVFFLFIVLRTQC